MADLTDFAVLGAVIAVAIAVRAGRLPAPRPGRPELRRSIPVRGDVRQPRPPDTTRRGATVSAERLAHCGTGRRAINCDREIMTSPREHDEVGRIGKARDSGRGSGRPIAVGEALGVWPQRSPTKEVRHGHEGERQAKALRQTGQTRLRRQGPMAPMRSSTAARVSQSKSTVRQPRGLRRYQVGPADEESPRSIRTPRSDECAADRQRVSIRRAARDGRDSEDLKDRVPRWHSPARAAAANRPRTKRSSPTGSGSRRRGRRTRQAEDVAAAELGELWRMAPLSNSPGTRAERV